MNDLLLRSSAAIAISALLVGPPASADILEVFAKGVNPNDATTYNNVQQGWLPTCWAAAGSNVITPRNLPRPQAPKRYTTPISQFTQQRKAGYRTRFIAGGSGITTHQLSAGFIPSNRISATAVVITETFTLRKRRFRTSHGGIPKHSVFVFHARRQHKPQPCDLLCVKQRLFNGDSNPKR